MRFLCHLTTIQACDRRKQRGFFIGPALGSIIIVIIVSAFAFGIYRYISNSYSVLIENTNLMSIVSAAKSLKSGGSYADVDNAALQRMRTFGSMTGAAPGGTVRHRWNGTVVVTGTTSQLEIQYNDVPASACEQLLARATESGEFAAPLPTCNASGDSDLTFVAY